MYLYLCMLAHDNLVGCFITIPIIVAGRQIPSPHSIEGPIVKGACGTPERENVNEQLPREFGAHQRRKDARRRRRAASLAEQAEDIQLHNRLPIVLLYAAGGPDVRENELGYFMTTCRYRLGVVTSMVTQGVICAVAQEEQDIFGLDGFVVYTNNCFH